MPARIIKISVPGSKSITNRALLLAALTKNSTTIKNAGICDDTIYMISGLKKLGVKIQKSGTTLRVHGEKSTKTANIYTGNAGTATRFLTAFAVLTNQKVKIYGDKRMNSRPIHHLTSALKQLGAKIKDTNGHTPVYISPSPNIGGKAKIRGDVSSQFISALLMIAPFTSRKTTISTIGKITSIPYIEMTKKMIKEFLNKKSHTFMVESDASSASYISAYMALNPHKRIIIQNINKNSIQGDVKFMDYIKKMGYLPNLKPLGKIDMNQTPDLVMTFAVLAMFAKGITKITNIANLRVKESDRIDALKNEISKFGIKVETGKDFMKIHGDPTILKKSADKKITIETYSDHRIAMAFGILKDKFPHLTIKNPSCVNKSYKTFWKDLNKLIKHDNRN
ncbi:MAG: 3-phosphoshikimate 1-carboxyvinyltransferase [Candidatus Gracilibacteria bacterium]|jgi:3-phosphoshikimate 1-carboxyvinyltransferase